MEPWIEIRPLETAGEAGGVATGLSRRIAERAAWRAIVRERLGPDVAVEYNRNGAPVLIGALGHISISHTIGWIAVIWSPAPCAIDIEPRTRPLPPGAAERYGIATIDDWCALEAAYKYEGLTGRKPPPGRLRFLPHPELTVAIID